MRGLFPTNFTLEQGAYHGHFNQKKPISHGDPGRPDYVRRRPGRGSARTADVEINVQVLKIHELHSGANLDAKVDLYRIRTKKTGGLSFQLIASADPSKPVDANAGSWRKPWSQMVQSRWLGAVLHMALSKPYIDSVAWDVAVDHTHMELPLSGLVSADLQPKSAYRQVVSFRKSLSNRDPIKVSNVKSEPPPAAPRQTGPGSEGEH